MLRKRYIMLAAVAAAALFLSAGCVRTPEQRAAHMVEQLAAKLDLTDAQKAQMDRIKEEFLAKRPEMEKLRNETVREANALMKSAAIDKAKLGELTVKNQTQASDMIGFISAKFTEIHDMLTPEQREKLVSYIEKHHERRHW